MERQAGPSGPNTEEVPLDVLADKFEDDGELAASESPSEAPGTSVLEKKTVEAGPQSLEEEEYYEGEGEEEDYEDEDDEDDAILDALDWLDIQEETSHGGSLSSYQGLGRRPNAHGGQRQAAGLQSKGKGGQQGMMQPLTKQAYKLEGKVNVGKKMGGGAPKISSSIANALKKAEKDAYLHGPGKSKDKADRATVEQALDPRTRMVLFKMLNRGLFNEINGCVSTGKEANVYHAVGPKGNDMAVKVFKTSILVFRDRDRYVTGDWRFRRGYCKSNPRKMVKLWAEKETRNLIRLATAGIPCPTPIQLRLHVLVMSFIGHDGYAAPRLKVSMLTLLSSSSSSPSF